MKAFLDKLLLFVINKHSSNSIDSRSLKLRNRASAIVEIIAEEKKSSNWHLRDCNQSSERKERSQQTSLH